ncbi:hypothetical protein AF72_11210 [Xylella taiwanensis]|uniref:Uncharacterized protein n=1 Tax=Xylella taiwanensis TaxID=1444770 RepID=Z9JG91_9GAMM|nr:hypothetical protein AF72_11210 [Xylella taiwanensis]
MLVSFTIIRRFDVFDFRFVFHRKRGVRLDIIASLLGKVPLHECAMIEFH